ncbi:hypothetical protein LR48_Vigan707s001600 [Vigna angularis]|uniref:Uncharacterized protein n=1 Tax=Phaseolus angularis TaxID=3914 RepID=A0A0L9TH75_PHAAN|nr:hypothetical protein LR48_Vigan707s001600 [Vigna angularis]
MAPRPPPPPPTNPDAPDMMRMMESVISAMQQQNTALVQQNSAAMQQLESAQVSAEASQRQYLDLLNSGRTLIGPHLLLLLNLKNGALRVSCNTVQLSLMARLARMKRIDGSKIWSISSTLKRGVHMRID